MFPLVRNKGSLLGAKQRGVTLIESLIAMLIGSIGLLAVASMQFNGLRANNASMWRTQAALLAQDYADRMRGNVAIARTGGYDTAGVLRNDISQIDIDAWQALLAANLPAGVGTAVCAAPCAKGQPYTITIQWDELRDGNVEQFQLVMTP